MTNQIGPQIPKLAIDAAKAYRDAGYGLWLVGGWVRDALLGNLHADLDFATDALPEESEKVLARWARSKARTTGRQFGTLAVQKDGHAIEVTTFRREVYREDSRNPEVEFASDLKTDLSRRDFTVNAMAIELPDVEVVDPFGGLSDLAARRIATPLGPDISFNDDPLRMLRALRFVSTLQFELADDVRDAIAQMHERLSIISKERIRDEFSKLILGIRPAAALDIATATGLADEFIPELPALQLEQDPVHRHKDVFRHTLAVLDNAITAETDGPDLALRLSALFHDVGKPKTKQVTPKGVSFHHHEVVGAEMTEARLKELRYPARLIEEVRLLVYLHLRFHTYRLGWTDKAVRRYVRDAGGLYMKLNMLVRADCTTQNPAKALRLSRRMDELEERVAQLRQKEDLERIRPALDGLEVMDLLGVPPGPVVGEAIDFLLTIRMDEGVIETEEAKERLLAWHETKRK
ncbi:MAG TPA: CCA tRNA nucleotidyltransferase [Actinomycetota bacterium]|nr:CCA tRNA nucleotidyltransferase [Actinomycetota bacterium]